MDMHPIVMRREANRNGRALRLRLTPFLPPGYTATAAGRSLVRLERAVWDREVPSSNLGAPTSSRAADLSRPDKFNPLEPPLPYGRNHRL